MNAEVNDRISSPNLRKLLADLEQPQQDPDQEFAEIWVQWCEGRQIVPIGVKFSVCLGVWQGPDMPSEEVELFGRKLPDGEEVSVTQGNRWNYPMMRTGATIYVTNYTVRL